MKKKKSKLSVKGGKGKAGKGKKRNRSANNRSANASPSSPYSNSDTEEDEEGGTSGLSDSETELDDKSDCREESAERGVISRQSRPKVFFSIYIILFQLFVSPILISRAFSVSLIYG